MNAIISEVKEVLHLKRKQIIELQEQVNRLVFDQSNALKRMYELKGESEQLEREIYGFEASEKQKVWSNPNCSPEPESRISSGACVKPMGLNP